MKVTDLTRKLPWPRPLSFYDSDGPHERVEVQLEGARYEVAPTKEIGLNTGRIRYFVKCLTCDVVLHEATTGTSQRIAHHEHDAHNQPMDHGL